MRLKASHIVPLVCAAGVAASAAAQPPPGAVPIQGQTTVVDPIEAVAPGVPVPKVGQGAPLYTPEELAKEVRDARRGRQDASGAVRTCGASGRYPADLVLYMLTLAREETELQLQLMNAADRAQEATETANQARIDAARGRADQATVERTELARQAAIALFLKRRADVVEQRAQIADLQRVMKDGEKDLNSARAQVRTLSSIRGEALNYGGVIVPLEYRDLKLNNIEAKEVAKGGGRALIVSGEIENPRKRPAAVPPLAVTALDPRGFIMKTQVADASSRMRIPAGGKVRFAYEVKPRLEKTSNLLVTFGSATREPTYYPLGMFC